MALLDDIGLYLQALGIATPNTDLFYGVMPDTPPACSSMINYGGMPDLYVHGVSGVAYARPRIQIATRDVMANYQQAMQKALLLHAALSNLHNTQLNNTWYVEATPLQDPFLIKRDSNNRPIIGCNYQFIKQADQLVLPTLVGSGSLALWLEGSGSDLSGNGNVLSPGVAPLPVITLNNQPSLLFNGTTNYLTGTLPQISGSQTFTALTTFQFSSLVQGSTLFSIGTIGPSGGISFGLAPSSLAWYASSGASYTITGNNADIQPHIATISFDGYNLSLWIDGFLQGKAAMPSLDIVTPTTYLGVDQTLTHYFPGTFGELALYVPVLPNLAQKAIQSYLGQRWGIGDGPS